MESLESIAYEHGLELIETTSEASGYPRDLKKAIIGIETFEEAQELADRYGLTVREFTKRDGWQLWVRGGRMWEEYRLLDILGTDDTLCSRTWTKDELNKDFMANVSDWIADCETFDYEKVLSVIERAKDIYDNLTDIGDGEFYIEGLGIFPYNAMKYSYDTKHYIIGVSE